MESSEALRAYLESSEYQTSFGGRLMATCLAHSKTASQPTGSSIREFFTSGPNQSVPFPEPKERLGNVPFSEKTLYYFAINEKAPPMEVLDAIEKAVKTHAKATDAINELHKEREAIDTRHAARTFGRGENRSLISTFIKDAVNIMPATGAQGVQAGYAELARHVTDTLTQKGKKPYFIPGFYLALHSNDLANLARNEFYLLPEQMALMTQEIDERSTKIPKKGLKAMEKKELTIAFQEEMNQHETRLRMNLGPAARSQGWIRKKGDDELPGRP